MSRSAETSASLLRGRILRDVWQERERQEELCRQGKFTHTAASPDLPNGYRLTALVEEVGEAAEAVLGTRPAESGGSRGSARRSAKPARLDGWWGIGRRPLRVVVYC